MYSVRHGDRRFALPSKRALGVLTLGKEINLVQMRMDAFPERLMGWFSHIAPPGMVEVIPAACCRAWRMLRFRHERQYVHMRGAPLCASPSPQNQ
jgi:hypothetical protein